MLHRFKIKFMLLSLQTYQQSLKCITGISRKMVKNNHHLGLSSMSTTNKDIYNIIPCNSYQLHSCLPSQRLGIMSFVPLSKWGGIDLHNAGLHKSLGSDQFIVTSIVNDINNTCLSCNGLWPPREVSCIQTKSSEFLVTPHGPHSVDSLGS